ncbi:oligosaccharide flippase family protein [Candidatus Bathyarchaeota archaeon]|nr:oligosaccharide flippase family protein [Candidatus Bathyarchaeota archaeon]
MREAAQGSFLLLVGQIVSTVVLAVAVIIVAGLLGSEKYGQYTVVMVPVNIATLLMDFGTNSSLTRSLAIYHSSGQKVEARKSVINGLFINIISALIFSIGVYHFSDLISDNFLNRPELGSLLKIASFCVLGNALINTTNSVFLGLGRIELRSLNSMFFAVTKAVATLLLVYLGYGVSGYVGGRMAMLLLSGLVGMILVYFIVKNSENFSIKIEFSEVSYLLKTGVPFYLSSLVSNGLNQIYNSLMVIYASTVEIGNYGVALNFAVLASFLTGPIGTMLFPLFSRYIPKDPTLKMLYQDSVKYVSLITLPGALALIALADPMVTIIYDNGYPFASYFLKIYLLGYLLAGLGSISNGNFLNGQGRADINLRCSIINLVVGGILGLYIIPRYSIVGLIIALISTPITGLTYSHWFIKKTYNFSFNLDSSLRIYISSFSAFLVCHIFVTLIDLNRWLIFILGGILFVVIYLIGLKITKVIQKRDYEIFITILGENPITNPIKKIIKIYEDL